MLRGVHWGKIFVMPIATVNPATGKTEQTFDPHDDKEVEVRLDRAAEAAVTYRKTTFAERARWTLTAAELPRRRSPTSPG